MISIYHLSATHAPPEFLGFSEFLSEMVEDKRTAIFFISMFLSGVAIYECHMGYKWHLRDCRNNNTCPGTRTLIRGGMSRENL